MERRVEDSKVLFVTTKNYEQKQVAEVYEFYVFCETDETSPDATPMKKLGEKINTGKDNGYSGNEAIDKDDTFTVKNLYTNEETTKTIYVGANSYLRALSATGMSIAELNAQIEAGAIVHEDGTVEVIAPTVDTTPEETEPEPTPDTSTEPTDEPSTETKPPVVEDETPAVDDEEPSIINTTPFVIVGIAIAAVICAVLAFQRKKAFQAKVNEIIEEEETEE